MKMYISYFVRFLNIISIITPLVFNLYYYPILDFGSSLLLFYVDLTCIVLFLTSLMIYYYIEKDFWFLRKFIIFSIILVFLNIVTFGLGLQSKVADFIYVKYNAEKLEKIVQIYHEFDKSSLNKKYSLEEIKYYMNNVKYLIITSRNINIYRISSNDGVIFLLTGGFLSGIGFAYSENENRPQKYGKGTIENWNHVTGNWYSWYGR